VERVGEKRANGWKKEWREGWREQWREVWRGNMWRKWWKEEERGTTKQTVRGAECAQRVCREESCGKIRIGVSRDCWIDPCS
jgi:hypothetical protein